MTTSEDRLATPAPPVPTPVTTPPDAATAASKWLADIVICLTVALSLILALFFAYSLVERHADYPPTIVSVFLGLTIAALTYRFLGGVDGTSFQVGVLKLGGSAALLIGTTWFLSERIKTEMNILETTTGYRTQIEQMTKDLAARGQEVASKDSEIRKLQIQIEQIPNQSAVQSIDQIRKLKPSDTLIKSLRRMMEAKDPPFVETVRELDVRVTMVDMPGDAPLYSICPSVFADLYKDAEPNTKILLSRSVGPDGNNISVTVDRRGKINDDVCKSPERNFDLQIGCSTARTLFPEIVHKCADGPAIRGKTLIAGAIP